VGVEISVVTTFPSMASLIDGQSLQFLATVRDVEGTLLPGATVTWEVNDSSVASIDGNGVLQALHEGTATVRAVFRGVYGTASLAVLPAASIVLSQDSVAFRAVAGGGSPSAAVIQILSSGVGAIGALEASVQYAEGQASDWLTAALAGTQAPTSLTLTPETGSLPAGRYRALVAIDSNLNAGPSIVAVSLTVAGLTVIESDGATSVTESGGTDSLTIVLDAEPGSDVVVDVISGDETEATVAPARLTFTPETWDIPQTTTVTGQDDPIRDGDVTTPVTVRVVDALSDPAFGAIPDQTILALTIDDETAGFTVVESKGSTVVTQGGSDDFTVVLDVQPASNVVLDLSSAAPGVVRVSPSSVTFTPESWSSPQVVVVTGTDGDEWGIVRAVDVTLSVDDELSDDGFDALPDQTVSVILRSGLISPGTPITPP
jgi:hypothetical protein